MKLTTNTSLAGKLSLSFGAVLAVLAALSIHSVRGFGDMNSRIASVEEDGIRSFRAISYVNDQLFSYRIFHYQAYTRKGKDNVDNVVKELKPKADKVAESLESYEKTISDNEDKTNYEATKAAWEEYLAADQKWGDLILAGKSVEANDYLQTVLMPIGRDKLIPAIEKVKKWNIEHAGELVKQGGAAASSNRLVTILLSIAASILAVISGLALARSIKKPVDLLSEKLVTLNENGLTNMVNGLAAMENADLTYSFNAVTEPIMLDRQDELGRLCGTFDSMLEKVCKMIDSYNATRLALSDIVCKVQRNAEAVADTSGSLASAATDTDQVTSAIAGTAQQVASAIDEVARSSQQIAEGSEQLARTATDAAIAMEKLDKAIAMVDQGSQKQAEAAGEAATNVKSGISAVEETVSTMHKIELQVRKSSDAVKDLGEKGQQIGEIVQTIEDIAQQTNLLALNAAIEAARAGEQGKGFAVVADEVRKLAERSALATQEIAALISSVRTGVDDAVQAMASSTEQVSEGAAQSREAGNALEKIMATTQAVSEAAQTNRSAVVDMVRGAEQVSMSITTVASVSQENAASAEEMSASTEEVTASAQTVMASTEQASASVQHVSGSAHKLNAMADELNEAVGRFKVEGNAGDYAAVERKRAA